MLVLNLLVLSSLGGHCASRSNLFRDFASILVVCENLLRIAEPCVYFMINYNNTLFFILFCKTALFCIFAESFIF